MTATVDGGVAGRGGGRATSPPLGEPWGGRFLDLRDEGYGFLRVNGYLPSRDDVYVSVKQAASSASARATT